MSSEITQVVAFLAQPSLPLSDADKPMVTRVAHILVQTELDDANRAVLTEHLMAGRKTKDLYKAIVIENMLLRLTKKPLHSARLRELLLKYRPDLKGSNELLIAANWHAFSDDGNSDPRLSAHADRTVQRHYFNRCVDQLEQIHREETGGKSPEFSRTNRVVVLTKQMLMPPHAPSVRTLEFSKNLIEDYGKQVLIVCSSEVSSQNQCPIVPQPTGNYGEQFLTADSVTYGGHKIPFLMCGGSVFSDASARQGIRAILDFGPEMILSIGNPNLLAEVFHDSAFLFFYMSGRGIPISRHHYFHTWNPLSDEEEKTLKSEGILDHHLFVSTPGYHKRVQSQVFERHQCNIPDDAFVFAIIGLRLDGEVTDSFMKVLHDIASAGNAYFLFAGQFINHEAILQADPLVAERSRFIGMQDDIMAVYGLADAYLNPERKGGGSSAAQALQAGLPVISSPRGDVGFMCEAFPKLEDYAAITEVAIALMKDPALLEAYKGYAKADSDRISVRNAYLARIMQEFDEFAKAKEAAAAR